MAFYDDLLSGLSGRNIFGVRPTAYPEGLLNEDPKLQAAKIAQANKESVPLGLLGTVLGYAIQPRDQGIGLGGVAAKSYMTGMEFANKPYENLTKEALANLEISKAQPNDYREYRLAQKDKVEPFTGSFVDYQTNKLQPNDYKEYKLAQKDKVDPFMGSFIEYQTKMANARRPITNVSAVANSTNKDFASGIEKNFVDVYNKGNEGRKTKGTVLQMRTLLNSGDVRTGFGSDAALSLSRIGQAFNPNFDLSRTAATEQYDSFSTKIVLPQVKQLGVNPTNTDLEFIVRGSAGISKSKLGNEALLDALELGADRDIAVSNFTNQWHIANANEVEKKGVLASAKYQQALGAFTTQLQKDQAGRVAEIQNKYNQALKDPEGKSDQKRPMFNNQRFFNNQPR